MSVVRVGSVGVGGMGQNHLKALKEIEGAQLVAVCDISEATAKRVGEEFGVPAYTDHRKMIAETPLDAITVATPHPQHAPVAIDAMNARKHVFTEKPMASTVSDCDRMITAAEKNKVKLSVMYQQRTFAVNEEARRLIRSGEIGELVRVSMTGASMRTQAYYNSAAWRGTWEFEGGGVLLNQAPHEIDLLIWLVGMPKRVTAFISTFAHKIQVEDAASAILVYPNGAHGVLQVSTVEAPRTTRYEIAGTKAKLLLEGGKLRMAVLEQPSDEFILKSKEMWGSVKAQWKDVEVPAAPSGHKAMIEDFIRSLQENRPSLCTGAEGRQSVELADAIIMSSVLGKTVDLPLNPSAYDRVLKKLIKQKAIC